MSGRPLRLRTHTLLALPCLVVAFLAGLPARPAVAVPISHCTTTKGVVVVVDFRHFGGAVNRGCGPTPTTGYDAMHHAGFSTAGDDQDGPAFVCRIDDFPTPAQQSCARTPPTSASWSYWHANAGQNSWSFSELGSMSTHPKAGSVDAWVYGSTVGGGQNGQPSFSPASVRAKGPAPTPTPSRPTPGPSHPPTKHAPRHHGSSAVPPDGTASSTPSLSPSRPTHHRHRHRRHGVTLPLAVPSPTSAGPSVVDQAGSAPLDGGSSGSPTGLIVGIILVVVLGGAGGLTAWRRRQVSA
jgi:hypothetical protein